MSDAPTPPPVSPSPFPGGPTPPPADLRTGLAIWSLVCGILGAVTVGCLIGVPVAIVGIVLGEFTVGALFSIYGAIYSMPVYHFWG